MWDMEALCQARYEPLKYEHGSIVTTGEVPRSKKRSRRKKKPKESSSNEKSKKKRKLSVSTKVNGERKYATLDDCLTSRHLKSKAGWSGARVRAYSCIDTNPNQYYYRFNAPGEKQRTGDWTPEEEVLLLDKVREHNTLGEWGLLAMHIPGRVGYQCSAQFRKLCDKGRITKAFLGQMKPGRRGNAGKKSSRSSSAVRGSSSSDSSSDTDETHRSSAESREAREQRRLDRKRKRDEEKEGCRSPSPKAQRTKRKVYVGSISPPVSPPGSPQTIDLDELERDEKRTESAAAAAAAGSSTPTNAKDGGGDDTPTNSARVIIPRNRIDYPPEMRDHKGGTEQENEEQMVMRRRFRDRLYYHRNKEREMKEREQKQSNSEREKKKATGDRERRRNPTKLRGPCKAPRPKSFFRSPKPKKGGKRAKNTADPRLISRHDLQYKGYGEPLIGRTRARYRRNLRFKSRYPEEEFSREANLFVFTKRCGQRADTRNQLMPYFKRYFGLKKEFLISGGGIPELVESRKNVMQERMKNKRRDKGGERTTRSLSPSCWMKYISEGFTQVVKAPVPPPARDLSPGKYTQFHLLHKNTPSSRPKSFSDTAASPRVCTPPPVVKRKRGRPPKTAPAKQKASSTAKSMSMSPSKKKQKVSKKSTPPAKRSAPRSVGSKRSVAKSEFSPPRRLFRAKPKNGSLFVHPRRSPRGLPPAQTSPTFAAESLVVKSSGSSKRGTSRHALRSRTSSVPPSPTSKTIEKHTPTLHCNGRATHTPPSASTQRRSVRLTCNSRSDSVTSPPTRSMTPTLTTAHSAQSPYRSALRRSSRSRSQSIVFSPRESPLVQPHAAARGVSSPAALLRAEADKEDGASAVSLPTSASGANQSPAKRKAPTTQASFEKRDAKKHTPVGNTKSNKATPASPPNSASKRRDIWALWAAGEREGLLQCDKCKRIYSRPDKLNNHFCRPITFTEEFFHRHPENDFIQCDTCELTYSRGHAYKLNTHKCESLGSTKTATQVPSRATRSCSPVRSSSSITSSSSSSSRTPHSMMTRRRMSLTPNPNSLSSKRPPHPSKAPPSPKASPPSRGSSSTGTKLAATRTFRSARLQQIADEGSTVSASSVAPHVSSPKSAPPPPVAVSSVLKKLKERSASVPRGGDSDEGSSVDTDELIPFYPERYKWARCILRLGTVNGRSSNKLTYASCQMCSNFNWEDHPEVKRVISFGDESNPTFVSRYRERCNRWCIRWERFKTHEETGGHMFVEEHLKKARSKSNFSRRSSPKKTPIKSSVAVQSSAKTSTKAREQASSAAIKKGGGGKPVPSKLSKKKTASSRVSKPASGDAIAEERAAAAKMKGPKSKTTTSKTSKSKAKSR